MSQTPSEKKPGLLAAIKSSYEHAKALVAVLTILVTLGASLYASLKPEEEKKAESTYDTLKAPVEEAVTKARANEEELRALRARVDFYEKVFANLQAHMLSKAADTTAPPVRLRKPPQPDAEAGHRAEDPRPLLLPERPWEQKKK